MLRANGHKQVNWEQTGQQQQLLTVQASLMPTGQAALRNALGLHLTKPVLCADAPFLVSCPLIHKGLNV